MCVHKIKTKITKYISVIRIIIKIVLIMKINSYLLFLFTVLLCACSTYFDLEYNENEIIPVIEKSDLQVNKIITEYKYGIDSAMNEVLCYSKLEMNKGKPESLLGNFVSDLCLEQFSNEADICIMNNGGLRNILPKGNVTKGIYTNSCLLKMN